MEKEADAAGISGSDTTLTVQTMQSWTGTGPTSFSSREGDDQVRTSERIINEAAQGILGYEESVDWFSSLEPFEQRAVLQEVVRYSMQAHATAEDGREGVSQSGVKPTITPAVLIVRAPILEQMGKILNLPPSEYVNSFRVLLSTFTVADTRRRETECRGSCSHPWHNMS
ncbi:DUF5958 family protein [Streptomyces sp. NPDC005931]|uniref:DUF5958 family protein n=1 Tax=Streptomyces sp. NPDC005931 TaxID=3364737 RepID=UPI00369A79FC